MSVFIVNANTAVRKKKHSVVIHYIFGCFWHVWAVFGDHQVDVTIYMGKNTSSS